MSFSERFQKNCSYIGKIHKIQVFANLSCATMLVLINESSFMLTRLHGKLGVELKLAKAVDGGLMRMALATDTRPWLITMRYHGLASRHLDTYTYISRCGFWLPNVGGGVGEKCTATMLDSIRKKLNIVYLWLYRKEIILTLLLEFKVRF